MNEQIKQYKETLNYANVLSELLRNLYRAWEFQQSGFREIEILIRALPPNVRKDVPDIIKEYNATKEKINSIPHWGSRLSSITGRHIPWQHDVYNIEREFCYDFAIERLIEALDKHGLLIYSDRPVEQGQYYNVEDLKPEIETNEDY